jgi:hypothetical protein
MIKMPPIGAISMAMQKAELLPASQLKQRGWTEALIIRFLGAPDDERPNPHYRSGPPMRLYNKHRVEQVEVSSEFREVQNSRRSKREAARKAIETKRRRLAEYVATVEITIPQLSKEELVRHACDHYNTARTDDNWASPDDDRAFLDRICVNYLRHRPQYETELRKIAGKVACHDAYLNLKERVLDAIAEAYPWLSDECYRQIDKMWDSENERARLQT